MRNYWIAINKYRTYTDDGFGNTWHIYRCTRPEQRTALNRGLLAKNGRAASYTTFGVRLATSAEVRKAKREAEQYGDGAVNDLEIEGCY